MGINTHTFFSTNNYIGILCEQLLDSSNITDVNFTYCYFGDDNIKLFSSLLKCNFQLKCINLSNSHYLSIPILCDGLINNVGIEKLRLQSCDINDDKAIILADSLKNHFQMTFLDLSDNNIGVEGFVSLFLNLKVRHFDATHNNLSSRDKNDLAGALCENYYMTMLETKSNSGYYLDRDPGVLSILDRNKHNKALRYFTLLDTMIYYDNYGRNMDKPQKYYH